MDNGYGAHLIALGEMGARVCAAAARISTTDGTALEVFQKGDGGARDLGLIRKVLASGHKSLMEHHVFSIAFENVSVLVEQFLIEFRLASFTVKSRRYVNFENAGFYTPPHLTGALLERYRASMREQFSLYARLLDLGVPKEDARFVLPYCFFSNFYVTCNARELIHIICSMAHGRGADWPEIRAIGEQLERQFDAVYPGVIQAEKATHERCAAAPLSGVAGAPHVVKPSVELLSASGEASLETALRFTGRFGGMTMDAAVAALTRDARPRELECLTYMFLVKDLSLAGVTHLARHRMQSPLFLDALRASERGGYILPETVRVVAEARDLYEGGFARNQAALSEALAQGLPWRDAAYHALAGNATDVLVTMNARELLHFLKLRTCTRAQWEIRELSLSLLEQLRAHSPGIFNRFGPSCAVDKSCPEGRLSCGKPQSLLDGGHL